MGNLIENWLTDQRVRFAATAINALSVDDPTNPAIAQVARYVANALEGTAACSLPTIAMLAKLPPESWTLLVGDDTPITLALQRYRSIPQGTAVARKTFISRALAVIMQRHITLRDFITWARRTGVNRPGLTKTYWNKLNEVFEINGGQEHLTAFRDSPFLPDRLQALDDLFSAAFKSGLVEPEIDKDGLWLSLCYALASQQFYWPLLSVEFGAANFGVSLPLDMGLTYAPNVHGPKIYYKCKGMRYRPPCKTEADSRLHGFGDASIKWTTNFHRSFLIGLTAGRALWRSQNGRAAQGPRMELLGHSLQVDFTWANHIVADLPTSGVVLSGRSAELYFSQVTLSLLLGGESPLGVATGTVDSRSTLLPTGYVSDSDVKVQYARETGFFSRLILPSALSPSFISDIRPGLDALQDAGQLEVNYCPTARSAADSMQRGGWRRAAFLHAPEERFVFYETLGRLFDTTRKDHEIHEEDYDLDAEIEATRSSGPPMSSSEMDALERRVNRWLKNSKGVARVFVPETELRPQLVGASLAWLDHITRIDPSDTTGPGLGVLFARFCRGDNEIRFWSQVFRVMGVNPDLRRRFQWATVDQARGIFCRIMNNFGLDPLISSSPPPDLLVIMDEEGVSSRRTNEVFPDDFRGQLYDVFDGPGIASQLIQRDEARIRTLGSVRVLILRPRTVPSQDECVSDASIPEELRPLYVFRSGFTVHLSAAAWNHGRQQIKKVGITEARERLDKLMLAGWLGRHRGEYYIRWRHRKMVHPIEAAPALQLAVAKAWAPVLDNAASPAVNRDSVFEERALDESIWHVRAALEAAVPRMHKLRAKLRSAQVLLLSLLPDADWDLVRPLMSSGSRGRAEAYELVQELLSAESETRGGSREVHSSRYALAINTAARRIRDKECDRVERETIWDRVMGWWKIGIGCATESSSQLIKLESEFAFFLRVWEGVAGESCGSLLGSTEELIEGRLKVWWLHRKRAEAWREVPISMSWMRERISDERSEDERGKDARLAAELWLHNWPEPWLLLLGLMKQDAFASAEVAGVFNLLGDSPISRIDSARSLGRAFRLRSFLSEERIRISQIMVNIFEWTVCMKDPLEGHRAIAAKTLAREWVSESHNCFDFVARLPSNLVLSEDGSVLDRQYFGELRDAILSDSWGCWSIFSRLPKDLEKSHARRVVMDIASHRPRPKFEEGLVLGDKVDRFSINGIPERFYRARGEALRWLKNLKVAGNDWEYDRARARVLDALNRFYDMRVTVVDGIVVSSGSNSLEDAR